MIDDSMVRFLSLVSNRTKQDISVGFYTVQMKVGSGRGAGPGDLFRGTDVKHAFLQHFMCRARIVGLSD